MDNSKEIDKLQKQIKFKLYGVLFIYTIIGFSLIILLNTLTSLDNIILKKLMDWITLRLDILFALYIIIGYCFIFNYYWNKPWKYFNEILNASEILYKEDDSIIKLSEPLKEVESKMNQVKMSMILNQQITTELQYKKDEVIMYLAHDIRTPLTSIIGYLSLLSEVSEMNIEKRTKYIKLTLEKSYRLEKLINEFFEFTRYNSKQIKLDIEEIDLYYLLFQMIDEFYPIFSTNGHIARLHGDENIIILGDPVKLARAFGNILKNATIYSYKNTEIIINIETIDDKVSINFHNEGNTIPKEKLSQIFEKFYRCDDARTSNTGGSGLGLAIAKEIILLHRGEIYANSENCTTDINIVIPLKINRP